MTQSQAAVEAVFAQETDAVFVTLLTIEHSSIEPIRVCLDGQQVVSNGQTFEPFPFEIRLPKRNGQEMPRVTLRIDNVDQQIIQALRAIDTPPQVTAEVVLTESPDTREAGPYDMTLRSARAPNASEILGELAFEDVLNQPWPAASFTPNNFPGLF
jgi:hypothetical protein